MAAGILKSITNTGSDAELASVFVAPLSIVNNAPSFAQDSLNLRRRASSQGVQRWEITANLAPTSGDASFLLHSILYGHHSVFYARMPQVSQMKCSSGNIVLDGTFLPGEDLINFSGTSKLVPGEFINIGNDPKVYVVVEAGSGGVGARIFPPLRMAAPGGAVIKTDKKVTLTVRFNADVQLGISYSDGVLSDPGSISLIEALV
jgi:hypothetical protein